MLSRELRADLGIATFVFMGSFSTPEVKGTISPGNVHDFHGGEMETALILAEDPSLVKMDTAKAGHPNVSVRSKGLSINWISEDWVDDDGQPIGIGGDPRGATPEKGEIIFQSFVRQLVDALIAVHQFHEAE